VVISVSCFLYGKWFIYAFKFLKVELGVFDDVFAGLFFPPLGMKKQNAWLMKKFLRTMPGTCFAVW
jgi:hypothetical protein